MSGDGAEDTGNSSGNPIGEAGIDFGEDAAGGRWPSYAELAEIRGIGRESPSSWCSASAGDGCRAMTGLSACWCPPNG